MPISFLTDMRTKAAASFSPKFYIMDNNGKWVDFSDTGEQGGVNALVSVGKISNKIEEHWGALTTSISDVLLDNADGLFNRPLPGTIKTINGTTASFSLSKSGKRTVLTNCLCRIAVQHRVTHGSGTIQSYPSTSDLWTNAYSFEEQNLAYGYIKSVTPDFTKNQIKLRIISIDGMLNEKDASQIKNGYDFYQYRALSYLVQQIVESELGPLPSTANIDRTPWMASIDNQVCISNLGKPPLWDGTNYQNRNLYCRSMHWTTHGASPQIIYMGLDNELWSYNPSTGVYTYLDSTLNGRPIKKIVRGSSGFLVWSWDDEFLTGYSQFDTTTDINPGWPVDCELLTGSTLSTVYSGHFCSASSIVRPFEWWGWQAFGSPKDGGSGVGYPYATGTGYSSGPPNGENFLVPYPQDVNIGVFTTTNMTWEMYTNDWTDSWNTAVETEVRRTAHLGSTATSLFFYAKPIWSGFSQIHEGTTGPSVDGAGNPSGPLQYRVGQSYSICNGKHLNSGMGQPSEHRHTYIIQLKKNSRVLSGVTKYNWSAIGDNKDTPTWNEQWGRAWYKLTMFRDYDGNSPSSLDLPTDTIPLCMNEMCGNSVTAFMFTMKHVNTTSKSTLGLLTWDTSSESLSFVINNAAIQSTGNYEKTPIAVMPYYSNSGSTTNDRIVIVWFDRGTAGKHEGGKYFLTIRNLENLSTATDLFSSCTVVHTSNSPITNLTQCWNHVTTPDNIYAFETGSGRVLKITKQGTFSVMNTSPVHWDETACLTMCADPLVADNLFGISAPAPQLETFLSPANGRYSLFRLGPAVSDVIKYADFTDLTKMEAIRLLSQARDFVSFFDRNGNFNFLPRNYTVGTADYTIGTYSGGINISKVSTMSDGVDDIYNIIRSTPYADYFTSPDTNALNLVNRTAKGYSKVDLEKTTFVDYEITQKDNKKKKVLAYCVAPGTTANGDSRWKYSVANASTEVVVEVDHVTSATVIDLVSVFPTADIADLLKVGDLVTAWDSVTGVAATRKITVVNTSTNQITLQTAFGFVLKKDQTLQVSRIYATGTGVAAVSDWSDYGVTYLAAAITTGDTVVQVKDATNLSVGLVVKFNAGSNNGDLQGSPRYEYRITEIDRVSSPNTITIVREDTGSGGAVVDYSTASVVYAWYSPKATDGYEIGGSGVFIKWQTGSGVEEKDYTRSFYPGDSLIINCPGTELKKVTGGDQVIIDGVSKAKYKSQELSLDNRFLDTQGARELGKKMLKYYAWPKFTLTLDIPLTPYIDLVTSGHLTQINVAHSNLFPASPDQTEPFMLLGVEHDISSGKTTLSMRGLQDY